MTGVRRTAVDRRAQLVEIGLELLPTTPVQELTVDEVARRAGISRSLLFHYFATKAEYYTAVLQAAAALLRDHVVPRPGTPGDRLPGMLDRFVTWVETYRDSYVAFVRGAHAGDPTIAEVYQRTREELVEVALAAVPLPDGARQRQLVRSWFAFTEDLVLQWTTEPTMGRAELLALITDVLARLTDRAVEPALR